MANSSDINRKTIAVFGAAGFIGAETARAFEADGNTVMRITSAEANLEDTSQLFALPVPPGAVWLLAAARHPDYTGDVLAANAAVARAAARRIEKAPPAAVVLLSSIDVYGRRGLRLPLHEGSPRNPQSPYAESKCISEDLLSEACGAAEIPLLTLRLPGVYGPGDPHHGPVRSFIGAAMEDRELRVRGDGRQIRDLLYVEDIPRIIRTWLKAPVTLLTNAVTGASASINHMIAVISETLKKELAVSYAMEAEQIDIAFEFPAIHEKFPELRLTPVEKGIAETCRRVQELRKGDTARAG
jgi:nucleoside-diphosphate-sugar epimerase